MKICILSSFEDSLSRDTGYSVRIYNLATSLVKSGNEVFLIIPGFNRDVKKVGGLIVYTVKGFLPKWFLRALSRLLGIAKMSSIYFYDPFFILQVGKIIKRADVVQIEQQSAAGIFALIISMIWKKPLVADCHDVLQALRVRHVGMLRKSLELFLEKITYKFVDLVLTVSEKEKELLVSYGIGRSKIEVVPNGVDTEEFNVRNYMSCVSRIKEEYGLENCRIVIFVGNMEYFPNKEAVRLIAFKIAPNVRGKIDNVKFLIVGRLNEKIEVPDLIFVGRVKSVAEFLSVSDVAIAPLLQGSGTRLKVLEYFSCSLPVVSTSVGVCGLDVEDGTHVLIADDLEEFSDCIVRLLRDKELASKLGNASRQYVVDRYDWKIIGRRLSDTYKNLVNQN